MPDEDIESGGQTDDSDAGDTGDDADAGSDEGGDRQAARSDAGDRPSRKERRANRMREATEAREAAVREAADLRERVARAEAAAADVTRRLEERERSTQNNDRTAQAKERITKLRQQAKSQLALSAQSKDPAQADKYWDEFQRLNDEADDLRDELRDAERWEKRKGELAGQIPDQGLMEEKQYIQAKYPWVTTNVEGRSLADGRFAALVASGRPPTRQTMEEALTYAARTLRLGGSSAPSEASRQRYVGTSGRDGEMDSGGSGGTMSADDVRNDLALKRMALSLYNTLDPEQAYAKFAKEVGTKAMRG